MASGAEQIAPPSSAVGRAAGTRRKNKAYAKPYEKHGAPRKRGALAIEGVFQRVFRRACARLWGKALEIGTANRPGKALPAPHIRPQAALILVHALEKIVTKSPRS